MKKYGYKKGIILGFPFCTRAYLFYPAAKLAFCTFFNGLFIMPVVCHAWKPGQSVYNGARPPRGARRSILRSLSTDGLDTGTLMGGFLFWATNSPWEPSITHHALHAGGNVVVVVAFCLGYQTTGDFRKTIKKDR